MFALSFVSREDPIHAWDLSRSHNMTIKLLEALSESLPAFLDTFRSSLSSSYNAVGDLLPALWELLTGSTDRGHFIMSLVIFYLAPLGLLLPWYSWRFFGGGEQRMPLFLGFCLTLWAFLYVPFWPALLGGFTDPASLTPMLIALGLALKTDITERQERRRMILLGISLYACFLIRRWFIFGVGSFYLTYALIALGSLNRGRLADGVKNIVRNLLTAGLASLVPMMIFQFPVFRGMILNRYSEKYAAFQSPLSDSLGLIYSTTGPVILFLAVVSPLIALIRRRQVAANLFAVICPVIFFAAFTQIQGLGMHHTLLVTMFIWLLAFSGLINLYQLLPGTVLKTGLGLLMTFLMVAGFQSAFSGDQNQGRLAPLLPGVRIDPLTHPNLDGLNGLILDLKKLTDDPSARIAVMASCGYLINRDLVENLMPYGLQRKHILTTKDIDKRDGINAFQLSVAKYVVVADPPDAYMNAEEQTIITIPANKILKGEGLGRAYRRVGEGYPLGQGVTGYIYERVRAFTKDEIEDYVRSFPPESENWPRPVTEDDKLLMAAVGVISNGRERMPFDKENSRGTYVIKPASSPATAISLNLEGLERIKFALSIAARKKVCGGRAKVSVSQPGLAPETTEIKAGEKREYDLDLTSSSQVVISAEGEGGTKCDYVFFQILEKR